MQDAAFEQLILFSKLQEPEPALTPQVEGLKMPDADVWFYRSFFTPAESDRLLQQLEQQIHWDQESIKLYGKSVPLPRQTAWYGDAGKSYTYSNIQMTPKPWTAALLEIKAKIEAVSSVTFNSVLLNRYRDGQDSVAWHSDDEPELGANPVIASISFGATRRFMFKHKYEKELKQEVELTHGSLLLMQGSTQHCWLHQIPKTKKPIDTRINLTFRQVQGKTSPAMA